MITLGQSTPGNVLARSGFLASNFPKLAVQRFLSAKTLGQVTHLTSTSHCVKQLTWSPWHCLKFRLCSVDFLLMFPSHSRIPLFLRPYFCSLSPVWLNLIDSQHFADSTSCFVSSREQCFTAQAIARCNAVLKRCRWVGDMQATSVAQMFSAATVRAVVPLSVTGDPAQKSLLWRADAAQALRTRASKTWQQVEGFHFQDPCCLLLLVRKEITPHVWYWKSCTSHVLSAVEHWCRKGTRKLRLERPC